MAQYLRSLSTRIPTTVTCLTNGSVYLSVREFTQFGSVNPNTHTFAPGFHLPLVKPNQQEGCGIKSNSFQPFQPSQLPPLHSTSVYKPLGNVKLDSRLLVNPQPKPDQDEKNASSACSAGDSSKETNGKPTPDQLNRICLVLQEEIPQTFMKAPDVSFISKDIVLVDNIRGKVFQGQAKYVGQLNLLRVIGFLKYSRLTVDIVSMRKDLKDGTVIVQWRIKAVPGYRKLLKFWKFRLWDWEGSFDHEEVWHEGISYYEVSGTDGKVYKLTVDKVMHDRLEEVANDKKRRLIEKLKLKLAGAPGAVSLVILGTFDSISPT